MTDIYIHSCVHVYFAIHTYLESEIKKMAGKFKDLVSPPCPHCHMRPKVNWRKATREDSVHSHDGDERYRDETEAAMTDEEAPGSASSSLRTAKPKAAKLFKAPPAECDEDSAVLV